MSHRRRKDGEACFLAEAIDRLPNSSPIVRKRRPILGDAELGLLKICALKRNLCVLVEVLGAQADNRSRRPEQPAVDGHVEERKLASGRKLAPEASNGLIVAPPSRDRSHSLDTPIDKALLVNPGVAPPGPINQLDHEDESAEDERKRHPIENFHHKLLHLASHLATRIEYLLWVDALRESLAY